MRSCFRRIVNDEIGATPIGRSFAAFERPAAQLFALMDNDVLSGNGSLYDFSGRNLAAPSQRLGSVRASRELWFSWSTFHPGTQQYQ